VAIYNHMVVDLPDATARADRVFHALSDATRRDIVGRTRRNGSSVSGLARQYPMSITAVQKHVAVLEAAGLVTRERRGREQIVRAELETVRWANRLLDLLAQDWTARIERFGNVLDDDLDDDDLDDDDLVAPDSDAPRPGHHTRHHTGDHP